MKARCRPHRLPLPGEVSLVHHGMLLLDDPREVRPYVLEGVRQPRISNAFG
jgi:predicted ATPase with chaperone activity